MGFVLFLLGFLLCGFMYVVWKVLRGEDVAGFEVKPKRKYDYIIPRYTPSYKYTYDSYMHPTKTVIDTNQEAIDIVELFDDLLVEKGIKVPSDEDDDRGEDNEAALYGMVYAGLLDEVEDKIRNIVKRCEG